MYARFPQIDNEIENSEYCHLAVIEPINFNDALQSSKWRSAMEEEIRTTERNGTWELVGKPLHKKAIGVKWIYKIKFNLDGSVLMYKVRLFVN